MSPPRRTLVDKLELDAALVLSDRLADAFVDWLEAQGYNPIDAAELVAGLRDEAKAGTRKQEVLLSPSVPVGSEARPGTALETHHWPHNAGYAQARSGATTPPFDREKVRRGLEHALGHVDNMTDIRLSETERDHLATLAENEIDRVLSLLGFGEGES